MFKRTRIKMCGTTRIEDAVKACQFGVDAVGFIFAEKSPRYISPKDASEIVKHLPPFLFKVGVFVNEGTREIEEIIHYLGLNGVQLHGNESPPFCEIISKAMPSCSVMKAVRIGEHTSSGDFSPFNDVVEGFVLDTYVKNVEGGTGVTFDWGIIDRLQLKKPFILAGGLNPGNISLALEKVSPFAVDVNSGVEELPGLKNTNLLRRFIESVQTADRKRCRG